MRFLLVSQPRSGTHMLRGVFMNHPDVVAWYDYNNDRARNPGALYDYLKDSYEKNPVEKATGAMTHVVEVPLPSWHWKQLRDLHDRVVVLLRSDLLRRYLSIQLLNRDQGDWASKQPRKEQLKPIRINPKDFLQWVDRSRENTRVAIEGLRADLIVDYQELDRRWGEATRRVYRTLELPWNNPACPTYRQETRPLFQIMENWESVQSSIQPYI